MLSEHAKDIIKDVENVRKKRINIDCLLQKYPEKPEKDFIQKYAETEIAIVGVLAYWYAIIIAIISIMLTIAFFFYPEQFKANRFLYEVLLIILFISYIPALYFFYSNKFKRNVVEEIILEIEDINLQTNMETKPIVISKLDIIISKVEAINPRIDVLEKNVSNKIEA